MQDSWKIRIKSDGGENKERQASILRYDFTSLHAKRVLEMITFTEIHLSFLIFIIKCKNVIDREIASMLSYIDQSFH